MAILQTSSGATASTNNENVDQFTYSYGMFTNRN